MYSVSFMFEPLEYDEDFYQLDALIADVALSMGGFVGKETWHGEMGRVNSVYYWDTLDDLKAFASHPKHIEAKRQYSRWYKGFHIVIAEIVKSYGDGNFMHITPNQRQAV